MGLFDFLGGGEKLPPQTPFLKDYGDFVQMVGGSQATMYTAKHKPSGMQRVVKKVVPKDKNGRQRVLRELEICLGLKEKHLIEYYGYEIKDEEFYILMEYFPGVSLRTFLRDAFVIKNRKAPLLTGRNFLTVCLQSAQALSFVHQKGYLHLDVKPENLMVRGLQLRPEEDTSQRMNVDTEVFERRTREQAGAIELKLIDFGISVKEGEQVPLGGSMFYVAPEVVQGPKGGGGSVSQAADVYSLGCTFYEVATGQPPYLPDWFHNRADKNWMFYYADYEKLPREARVEYEKDMVRTRLTKPVDANKVPHAQAVRDIILKCLHPSPVKRYATSYALARDLDGLLSRF